MNFNKLCQLCLVTKKTSITKYTKSQHKISYLNTSHLLPFQKPNPFHDIMEAYNAGQRIFGENKIQEMVEKHEAMPKDIEWHMIGHVQRNKVKYMAAFVTLIHGVDNFKLLKEINKQAKKHNQSYRLFTSNKNS